jgi:hypothetical protein
MSTPSLSVVAEDTILPALSSLGWLRYASRLGAAGLLDDTEFLESLDQLATLVKATLAYRSAGPKPVEPPFGGSRRSSAPGIMNGALGIMSPPPSRPSRAVEAHPRGSSSRADERRNSLERISENVPGHTDEANDFSEMGLALRSSASRSTSPSPSPSPSGSPTTQRRSCPPTMWSLWQKFEPAPSGSPCGSPKARRRSIGGHPRPASSDELNRREPGLDPNPNSNPSLNPNPEPEPEPEPKP